MDKQVVSRYEELRRQGMTYREIAEAENVTRDAVIYTLYKYGNSTFRHVSPERCIYTGLRNWLNENECTITELVRRIYGREEEKSKYHRLLRGCSRMTMAEIDDIISVTGRTYEELFGLKGE